MSDERPTLASLGSLIQQMHNPNLRRRYQVRLGNFTEDEPGLEWFGRAVQAEIAREQELARKRKAS